MKTTDKILIKCAENCLIKDNIEFDKFRIISLDTSKNLFDKKEYFSLTLYIRNSYITSTKEKLSSYKYKDVFVSMDDYKTLERIKKLETI